MTTNDDLDVALIRRRDARLAGLAEQARAVSSPVQAHADAYLPPGRDGRRSRAATVASIVDRVTDPAAEFAAERAMVRRFDAGDQTITLDEYDDAVEALVEAGIEPI